jgi:hypothetical protein
MATSFSSDIDFGKLEKMFAKAPDLVEKEIRQFLKLGVLMVYREVKIRTPKNDGRLWSSVGHSVKGVGLQQQGIVGTPVDYAPFVELNTKPHWAPFDAIEFWVKRKFGLSGTLLYLVTRAVRAKIARKGTKGAFMFKESFEITEPELAKQWDALWARIVKQDL